MIKLGQLIIAVGFLVGSLATVLDPEQTRWPLFAVGMVAGIIGIVMVQIGFKRASRAEDTLTSNIKAIRESLAELAEKSEALDREKRDIFVYDMHGKIDELFPNALDRFVQARESIIHVYSVQDYADVMNHFAAGERAVNRVWSASVDGYVDEVSNCMAKAALHFKDAWELFSELDARKSA